MEWITSNIVTILSLLFGAGSIGYACIQRALDRKKYQQTVREATANADIKSDEFWKARYDVLQKEVESKDIWWKQRYDTLYSEFQSERQLSNNIVKSFREELNQMRIDYEQQRENDRKKYDELLKQYRAFEEESNRAESNYRQRIAQLENLVSDYEAKLNKDNE